MAAKLQALSVFFPTYNEEGNIKNVVENTLKVLPLVAERWEIIIVNDGSKDDTLAVAKRLALKNNKIRVINHKSNKGYGGALKTGFSTAKYPWVACTDSDGQFDFSEIKKFLPHTGDTDLILGYRLKRADPLSRKVFTFGWSLMAKMLVGLDVRDYSCGFKLIKKKVFDDVQPLVGEEKVTQIELLVKARKKGFKFSEVGVKHYPRASGSQTGADLKVVIKSVWDLIKLRKLL